MVMFIKVAIRMVSAQVLALVSLERLVRSIEVSGAKTDPKVTVFFSLCQMRLSRRDLMDIESLMVKSSFYCKMENSMKEIVNQTCAMPLVFIITRTVIFMTENGSTIVEQVAVASSLREA